MEENNENSPYYVLNLNMQRIVMITGIILILLSSVYLFGHRIGKQAGNRIISESVLIENANEKAEQALEERSNLSEQALINDFNEDIIVVDNDDFGKDDIIKGPPSKSKTVKSPVSKPVVKANNKVVKPKTITAKRSGKYTIQVAAFSKEKDANSLRSKMKKKGISARVDRGTRFYYVRSGLAKNRQVLKKNLDKIIKLFRVKPYLKKLS